MSIGLVYFLIPFYQGAVTGDLIKMFYLKQVDSNLSKTSMFLTVLMDRIYGLIGLITLMGIISLFRFNTLTSISGT